MTSMDWLITAIEKWSTERGLDKINPKDSSAQLAKLMEEVGELAQGELKLDGDKVVDSVGDLLVVIIIYCQQRGLDMTDCLQLAYENIMDRKGKTVNGVFIKEEDLHD